MIRIYLRAVERELFLGWETQLIFCLVPFGDVDMLTHDILSVLRSGSSVRRVADQIVCMNKPTFLCVLSFGVTRNKTKTYFLSEEDIQ